jgi:hypothetical protein
MGNSLKRPESPEELRERVARQILREFLAALTPTERIRLAQAFCDFVESGKDRIMLSAQKMAAGR